MATGTPVTQFLHGQQRDGTFTDQNQLASAMATTPEVIDQLIYAFGDINRKSNKDNYGIIQSLTSKVATGKSPKEGSSYRTVGNHTIEWHVMGPWLKSIPISSDANFSSLDTPGINYTPIVIPLEEKYFTVGDVVITQQQKLLRLREEPYQSGMSWCHTFDLITNSPDEFVNPSDIEAGKVLAMCFTAFEEGSEGGGSKEGTPMAFRNTMNIQRLAWGMTGGAKTDLTVFNFAVGNQKQEKLWLYKKQYEQLLLWNRNQEAMIWTSRTNVHPITGQIQMFGSNGRVVRTGSGIEEQISGANHFVVNELTEDVLNTMLLTINQASSDASNTKLMVFTGAGGMLSFDRGMKRALGGLGGFVQENNTFIEKLEGNKLGYGANFTKYRGIMGTEFTVIHHPFFDDRTIWTDIDPATGLTTKSFEMYFIDMSDYGSEPNVQLIAKGAGGENRRLMSWFTAGSTTPDFGSIPDAKEQQGLVSKSLRSNGYDGFMTYCLSETGVIILNPLSCGKITIKRTF
jgi:hypothetical protein